MENKTQFSFEISLSVLNHLGRNLYRSFATVLGEAISNAWDADAENVWIYLDKDNNNFFIKDDGLGMSPEDFQGKFLKIGYSKRKAGVNISQKDRPYIGRKGIGKLALLSCARQISVVSKIKGGDYTGGIIDNSDLDDAIKEDLTPNEYPLGKLEEATFAMHIEGHNHGTIIYFEDINDGIKHSLDFLKKIIALYFRFSLIDKSFTIFVNDEEVTNECLSDLADKTEFLWLINNHEDSYVAGQLKNIKETRNLSVAGNISGFVASVEKPRYLKVAGLEERVSIDLFVNGRLREKDILKHLPTDRLAESYIYGQIHFNELDEDDIDRFTSSREGVVSDDPEYKKFLETIRQYVISKVIEDWDDLRRKFKKKGDSENEKISEKERSSEELFNSVAQEYEISDGSENKDKVNGWVNELAEDAKFNFSSYADCFLAENLVRKYIREKGLPLSIASTNEITTWRDREIQRKSEANINIELRQNHDDLSYLDMHYLSRDADGPVANTINSLTTDGVEFKPIRNAVMHTALLTREAKQRLNSIYDNIKARVKILLSTP